MKILEMTIRRQEQHSIYKASGNASSSRVYFTAILALALLLRVVMVLAMLQRDQNSWLFTQATELGCLAQSVLAGHGLASPFCGSTGPSAFLAPGYPLFIASIFRLFGEYTKESAIAIVACQTIFGLVSVLMLMLLARRIFGAAAANIAGTICAVSPTMVWLPELFWETSLSIAFLTGALVLALYCLDRPRRRNWAGMGLLCALAILVNPALVLTLFAILTWTAWRSTRLGLPFARPLLALAIWVLVFAAWPARNLLVLHSFIPLRSNLGYELWQGNRPGSDGEFSFTLHPNGNRIERARYAALGEAAYMREKSALATDAIEADPARFARLCFRRFCQFWTGARVRRNSPVVIASLSLTTLLAITGLVLLARRHPAYAMLLALPFVLFPLPYYVTHADFRFRLLLDPLAIMLGTYAIQCWYRNLATKRAPEPRSFCNPCLSARAIGQRNPSPAGR